MVHKTWMLTGCVLLLLDALNPWPMAGLAWLQLALVTGVLLALLLRVKKPVLNGLLNGLLLVGLGRAMLDFSVLHTFSLLAGLCIWMSDRTSPRQTAR